VCCCVCVPTVPASVWRWTLVCLTGPALGQGKVTVDTTSSAWTAVTAALSGLATKLNEICEEVVTHVVFDGAVSPREDYRAQQLVPAEECFCGWSGVTQRFVTRRVGTLTSGASGDARERGAACVEHTPCPCCVPQGLTFSPGQALSGNLPTRATPRPRNCT
jgi:hypothetical protein